MSRKRGISIPQLQAVCTAARRQHLQVGGGQNRHGHSSSQLNKLCGNSLVFGQSEEFDERAKISKSGRKFTKQVPTVSFLRWAVTEVLRSH